MNIISDYRQDTNSSKPIPGSYEWWYFDAISDDGKTSFVIIFYEGNPFSRRYIEALSNKNSVENKAEFFPAISISVYHKDKPVYYGFEEVKKKEATFSSDLPEGKIGKSAFRLDHKQGKLVYHLNIDHTVPGGDSIRATLSFESADLSVTPGEFDHNDNETVAHSWNLVQPAAAVTGVIEVNGYKPFVCQFSGIGYHDHNKGEEPMKDSFDEWYWGRFHLGGQTLIYYLMNQNGSWNNYASLIDEDGEVRNIAGEFDGGNRTLNLFGLSSYRKLMFHSKNLSFTIQQESKVDDGPFYQRFLSSTIIHKNGDILVGRGISEYIKPSRIYSKLFWPLVNMRIRYPGRDHWVQKKPGLYRWTW